MITTISATISRGRQTVNYLEYLNCNGRKLMISIASDAYDFQCHARLSALDEHGLRWNVVVFRRTGQIATQPGLIYQARPVVNADFKADRDFLVTTFSSLIAN